MSIKTFTIEEARLLSYPISGAGMRYIEVNEREISLRNDPDRGPILRGEVAGCGTDCHADLSQIFLEYAMSCEGCRDGLVAEEMADHFGQHLGQVLMAKLWPYLPEASEIDRAAGIFDMVVASLNTDFEATRSAYSLRYDLVQCPLHKAAEGSSFNMGIARAHRVLVAFCESLLQSLSESWVLEQPSERETEGPILTIAVARSR